METQNTTPGHSPASRHKLYQDSGLHRGIFDTALPAVRERSKNRAYQVLETDGNRPVTYRKISIPAHATIEHREEEKSHWVDFFKLEATIIPRKELFGEKIEKVTFLKFPNRILIRESHDHHDAHPHSFPEGENQILVPSEWSVVHFTK